MRFIQGIFLTLFFTGLSAATYYVSPDGNNASSGLSVAESWETIQHALNTVDAGDTILLMSGTYTEKTEWNVSGEADNYITLKNYVDDIVIIDGSTTGNNTALMYLEDKNYIRIEGIKFTAHNGNYQPVINCYGSNSHIEIRNCEIYNTMCNDSYAILLEGSGDDYIIENNYLHDLEGDNAVGILFVGSDTEIPFTNIIIRNNTLENIDPAPSEAIAVNGNADGFEISGNHLSDINNIGIVMIGGEDWVNTNDAVNFARNGVCRWNTVVHANSIYGGGYAGGIYVDGGKHIVLENNTVSHSDVGLEVGCENHGFIAEDITVRNNVLYKNEKSGLGFGGYDYPSTGNVMNCSFTGNTVFDNDSLLSGFGQLWIQHAENCTVRNNIFYALQSPVIVNAYDWDITALGNTLDHNLYYTGNAETDFYFHTELLHSFDDYRSESSQDTNSLFEDPLFADISSYIPHLHIELSSPAVNAGDPAFTVAPDELDMDSTARIADLLADIGADETGSTVEISENVRSEEILHIFPSPAIDHCFINGNLQYPAYIQLYSSEGKLISQQIVSSAQTAITLSGISCGLYIVKIYDGRQIYAGRLEVQ